MIYKKIIYDYFKSFIHYELDLHDGVNVVAGKNGTGKSTTGIGASWVFTGKDLELHDEPDIRNIDNVECESSCAVIAEIGGKDGGRNQRSFIRKFLNILHNFTFDLKSLPTLSMLSNPVSRSRDAGFSLFL